VSAPLYLDHAATTTLDPRVARAMQPALDADFGNPSSLHTWGRTAKAQREQARAQVAHLLNADAEEIYFTATGSESCALAVRGIAQANARRGRHLITAATEHHAVLHTHQALEREGWRVTYVPVNRFGRVAPDDLAAALTDETVLASVMHANNEIGTLQPIAELGAVCRARGVLFFTDAVQTVGHLPLDVRALPVDAVAFAGHKFYGPKGGAGLWVRRVVRCAPLFVGGGHERGLRSGTENVAAIVGLGAACELAGAEMAAEQARLMPLRDRLMAGLLEQIPGAHWNGHPTERLANNVNVLFEGVGAESLLIALDLEGIAASSGSACTSGSLEPSHVLLACGQDRALARGSLRLTLGRTTTAADIERVLETVPRLVARVRKSGAVVRA